MDNSIHSSGDFDHGFDQVGSDGFLPLHSPDGFVSSGAGDVGGPGGPTTNSPWMFSEPLGRPVQEGQGVLSGGSGGSEAISGPRTFESPPLSSPFNASPPTTNHAFEFAPTAEPSVQTGNLGSEPQITGRQDVPIAAAARGVESLQNGISSPEASVAGSFAKGGEDESNPLRVWERNHESELQKKRQEERDAKAAIRMQAAEELKNWHSERLANIAQRKNQNREGDENKLQNLVQGRGSCDMVGNEGGSEKMWTQVCRLLDFTSQKDGMRDTSRMKEVMLELRKREACVE